MNPIIKSISRHRSTRRSRVIFRLSIDVNLANMKRRSNATSNSIVLRKSIKKHRKRMCRNIGAKCSTFYIFFLQKSALPIFPSCDFSATIPLSKQVRLLKHKKCKHFLRNRPSSELKLSGTLFDVPGEHGRFLEKVS